jgi:hypothetical protein
LDTQDYKSYHDTRKKRPKRYKVRFRNYKNSNLFFIEVKLKEKGLRTAKYRTEVGGIDLKDKAVKNFLQNYNLHTDALMPVLKVDYNRICLVSKIRNERVTIDTDLKMHFMNELANLSHLAIIELKYNKFSNQSKFQQVLTKSKIKSSSFSKYCIGLALTNPEVNKNGLTRKIKSLTA